MIKERILFIQLVLICFCSSTPTIRPCAEWTIISPPIIFGKTARLGCELQNDTEGSTRTWQGGPGYTLISIDGASSNPKKYMEVTSRVPFRSLLEIYNFSENDVDCDYSCSIGYHEDRHKLLLNPAEFELHPTDTSTAIVANLLKGHLVVKVSLMKIYPKPECNIKFKGIDYINDATEIYGKNGKFFTAQITLDHNFNKQICKGGLDISCTIGKSDVHLYRQYFSTCADKHADTDTSNDKHADTDTSNDKGAVTDTSNDNNAGGGTPNGHHDYLINIVLGLGLLIVAQLILFIYLVKARNVMCCSAGNTGPDIAMDDIRITGRREYSTLPRKYN